MTNTKPSIKGHQSHSSGIETTNEGKIWGGGTPSVGQRRAYQSGSNAHGVHEKSRGGNAKDHADGGSSITSEHMIPSKDK